MLADDAAKHCCRNWLLFEGGAPFPVAAPTVVDAEGAELSGKPLVATTRRRHAARGGRDHQGVDGRNRDDCDLRLSLVFCDGCAGPLATTSLLVFFGDEMRYNL